jgi:hypothetical protein
MNIQHSLKSSIITGLLIGISFTSTCFANKNQPKIIKEKTSSLYLGEASRLSIYYPVKLTANLSHLTKNQKKMLILLIDASKIMDDLFWKQALGEDKNTFLNKIKDPNVRRFAQINYGPWDRLNGNKVFLSGYSSKSDGAQFYPQNIKKSIFEKNKIKNYDSLYSIIRYNEKGKLISLNYSDVYSTELNNAARLLQKASKLALNKKFASYLNMRAQALITNHYQASDFAWMDMKQNPIDLVIGPIESYEDHLYGYRAAFEAYVLIKDMAWSKKLAKYTRYLPELQKNLPVPKAYKQEMPGTDADLNAYDVIYYAGDSNAGSKTIAINLPNDEAVQLKKGTRRLQLKNAMKAKFEHILVPIAKMLIVPEQQKHITFTAFFSNVMFHEVSHGLGIKHVIGSKKMVRQALKEHASALEEGKADILGLYMIRQLLNKGIITEGVLEDYYVTFMAGIFRSVRFGASSAHGKANMIRFNFFKEHDAFYRNKKGLYQVNMKKMQKAIDQLSNTILILQGNGDYKGVTQLVKKMGHIKPSLQKDLQRLTQANIPVDITFQQGKKVLGLE